MRILKKILKLQIYIYSLFCLLTISLIMQIAFKSNLYNYLSLATFIIVIFLVYYLYKRSNNDEVMVSKNYLKIIKYNIYLFIATYAVTSFSVTEQLWSFRNIIYFSILFISSILGIVYNIVVFLKSK